VSDTPEQPPAAPDEPVTAVHEPTFAGPVPSAGPATAAPPPPAADAGPSFTDQHPEALVGGAFVGGAVLAFVLKRLGRR
jgi:hypothetical protein